MRPKFRSGFTMLEMLVTVTLLSVLLTASMGLLMRGQRSAASMNIRHETETEFDELLKTVGQEFGRRYTPAPGELPAFEILPPQAGLGQPGNCNGLVIRQRFPIAGNDLNVRVIRFLTVCRPGVLPPLPATFLTAYGLVCPANQIPTVRVDRWTSAATFPGGAATSTRTYPPPTNAQVSEALCFTPNALGMAAEGGAAIPNNRESAAFQKRLNWRTDDKSRNVEVIQ